MKHPDPSEWMAFLYGEVTRDQRTDLDAHLAVCPDCVRRLGRWRETMGLLDAAGVPERKPSARHGWVAGRWALAAAAGVAVLFGGFALGRQGTVTEGELDRRLSTLRMQLGHDLAAQRETDLREVAEASVRLTRADNHELMTEFLRQYQAAREEDRNEMRAALRRFDERHMAETARLKESLFQLASSTGTGFEQTQTQMRLLTSYLPASTGGDGTFSEDPNHNPQNPNP